MQKPTALQGQVTHILMKPLMLRVYPYMAGVRTDSVPREVIPIVSDSYALFTLSNGRTMRLAYFQFRIDTEMVGIPRDPDARGVYKHTLAYKDSKNRWYSHEIAEGCKQETCPRYMDNV